NQTGTRPLNTGSLVRIGGSNSFSGGVNLTAGNLLIAADGALGSGTLTVNGGSVQFDPAATPTFNIANPVTLNSTLVVTGTNTAATFGTLTVGGTASVSVLCAFAGAQTTTATFGGLARSLNGTVVFSATNLGSGTGVGESIVKFTTNPGGAVGGGGGPDTPTRSILPYAYADAAPSVPGTAAPPVLGLVRYDAATQRIAPLNPTTEYATNLFLIGTSAVPTANHRYASTADFTGAANAFGVAGLVGSATVNALVLD